MSNIRLGIGRRWRNSIRDGDGAFRLDPSKQHLVRRGVQPLRDLIDWLVYGTARLARDRAVVYCPLSIKPANAKKGVATGGDARQSRICFGNDALGRGVGQKWSLTRIHVGV